MFVIRDRFVRSRGGGGGIKMISSIIRMLLRPSGQLAPFCYFVNFLEACFTITSDHEVLQFSFFCFCFFVKFNYPTRGSFVVVMAGS